MSSLKYVPALAGLISLTSLSVISFNSNAASFDGPESVMAIHPLCIEPLIGQKEAMIDKGAFNMTECYEAFKDIEIKRTPDGGLYSKRPVIESNQSEGYVVYKPVGTLDGALELLLYHNKEADKPLKSKVIVMARLPHLPDGSREFITSIDEPGTRCNGGIQTARLVSEAILEVTLNSNAAYLMKTFAPELESEDSGDLASLSLKKSSSLDNDPTHCIASITKTYNLLDSRETLDSVTFSKGFRAQSENEYQQCFDTLVDDFITPPATVKLADMEMFKQLLLSNCGTYKPS